MPRHITPLPQFYLRDIYGTQQLRDVVITARERVFSAFDHATEYYRGKERGTYGYIASAGVKHSDLARYVLRHHMKPFVSLATLPSLPPQLIELEKHAYHELIKEIHERVVLLAVNELVDECIIWHDGCVWNVVEHKLIEYRTRQQKVTRTIKKAQQRERTKQKG